MDFRNAIVIMTSNIGAKDIARNVSFGFGTSDETLRAMSLAPMFEVMITIVLRKSTVRPWASVSRPSSRIWSRMLKTSGCAFSISSSSSTE